MNVVRFQETDQEKESDQERRKRLWRERGRRGRGGRQSV